MSSVVNSVRTNATATGVDPRTVNIQYARSTAIDSQGNLYVTSATCILVIKPPAPYKTGYNTVAGWTSPQLISPPPIEQDKGFKMSLYAGSINGGVELTTTDPNLITFYNIAGLCYDPNQNCIYVSDPIIHSITRIPCVGGESMRSTLLIGSASGRNGFTNGPQSDATLHSPKGLAVDSNSTIYIADYINNAIRKLVGGASGSGGTMSTVGTLTNPIDVCVTTDNSVYATSATDNCIYKFTPSGTTYIRSTYYTGLIKPAGLCRDAANNLFVYDAGNNRILLITGGASPSAMQLRSGISPLSASQLTDQAFFAGLTYDNMGNVYHIEGADNTIGILSSMPQ